MENAEDFIKKYRNQRQANVEFRYTYLGLPINTPMIAMDMIVDSILYPQNKYSLIGKKEKQFYLVIYDLCSKCGKLKFEIKEIDNNIIYFKNGSTITWCTTAKKKRRIKK